MKFPRTVLLLAALLLSALPALCGTVMYRNDAVAGAVVTGDGWLAPTVQLSDIKGIALDAFGNLYLSDTDHQRVRRVSPLGILTTVAGTGTPGYSGDNGPGSAARINSPYGLTTDPQGNLYIADYGNNRVRRVNTDGGISTFAGNGAKGSAGDLGPATQAQLNGPRNLAFDSAGNLYISEYEGHRIRKVSPSGIITTIAGTGIAGFNSDKTSMQPPLQTQLNSPAGLTFDSRGALYVADSGNNVIRRIWGEFMDIVVDGRADYSHAILYTPLSIAFDSAEEYLYVGELYQKIVKTHLFAVDQAVVTGQGADGYDGENKPAIESRIAKSTHDLAFDRSGALYFADGPRVRRIGPSGLLTTIAGDGYLHAIGDGGSGFNALLRQPAGMVLDRAGNLYFADRGTLRVRKISTDGVISTVAGTGFSGMDKDGVQATLANLSEPFGVTFDSAGTLYIADAVDNVIRAVNPAGIIQVVVGRGNFLFGSSLGGDGDAADKVPLLRPRSVVADAMGYLYIADSGHHRVLRRSPDNHVFTIAGNGIPGLSGNDGPARGAQLNEPYAIAISASGDIYIADTGNHQIRMVRNGNITAIAGTGGAGFYGDEGPAADAALSSPSGIALDSRGNIYIADTGNSRIRMIDSAGIIHTIGGGDGSLNFPLSLTVASNGDVFVADTGNDRLRRLTPFTVVQSPAPVYTVPLASVVNSASLQTGPVAPGEIISIFSPSIGPAQAVQAIAESGMVGCNLAGVQVTFDGIAAPVLWAESSQVKVQVPYSIAGRNISFIEVSYQNEVRARAVVGIQDSAPALLTSSPGQVIALNEDGTQNSDTNPAPRGSHIVLYATGEGETTECISGKIPAAPLPTPVLPVKLLIGGIPAPLAYAGSAPGLLGLMQINATVPNGFAPSGRLSIILSVGNTSSPTGVTIAVK